MGCKAAIRTDEFNGWECGVTGCACMFRCPNSKLCASMYGEGPDATEETAEETVEKSHKMDEMNMNTKKIVINNQDTEYEYAISILAIKKYLERKGEELHVYVERQGDAKHPSTLEKVKSSDRIDPITAIFYTKDLGEKYILSYDENSISYRNSYRFCPECIPRDDADLVAVIEELGEAASGLSVVEIPGDVDWEIHECWKTTNYNHIDGEFIKDKHSNRAWFRFSDGTCSRTVSLSKWEEDDEYFL